MIVHTEPKDFFMFTVHFIFNREHPDAEDAPVKAYLEEKQLYPKHTNKIEYQGWPADVWSFGGCYLGRHLGAIGEMQRKTVERELVTAQVERLVREEPQEEMFSITAGMAELDLQGLVDSLVEEFHQDSSFGLDDQGQLMLTLEDSVVEARFKELVGT